LCYIRLESTRHDYLILHFIKDMLSYISISLGFVRI